MDLGARSCVYIPVWHQAASPSVKRTQLAHQRGRAESSNLGADALGDAVTAAEGASQQAVVLYICFILKSYRFMLICFKLDLASDF